MPAEPSPAQSATSRLNGALSSGPVTADGKAASSANATCHGLRGGPLRLSDQETARGSRLRTALARRLRTDEAELPPEADAWAVAELKLARLDLLEMAALGGGIDEDLAAALPSLVTLGRYRARISRERDQLTSEVAAIVRAGQRPSPREAAASATAERDSFVAQYIASGRAAAMADMRTNEPKPASPSVTAAAPSPPPPLNRHERRRLAALERRAAS